MGRVVADELVGGGYGEADLSAGGVCVTDHEPSPIIPVELVRAERTAAKVWPAKVVTNGAGPGRLWPRKFCCLHGSGFRIFPDTPL